MHSEPLKIKKFQDKCKREEETQNNVRDNHDRIQKQRAIHKILKDEREREMK